MANPRIVLNEDDVPGVKRFNEPSKRWLHCHGLIRTGGKDELVEKVRLSIDVIKGSGSSNLPLGKQEVPTFRG